MNFSMDFSVSAKNGFVAMIGIAWNHEVLLSNAQNAPSQALAIRKL